MTIEELLNIVRKMSVDCDITVWNYSDNKPMSLTFSGIKRDDCTVNFGVGDIHE